MFVNVIDGVWKAAERVTALSVGACERESGLESGRGLCVVVCGWVA